MNNFTIRPLCTNERRDASVLVADAIHLPHREQASSQVPRLGDASRDLAAFAADEVVGTFSSFATRLVVPGGATLPAAATGRAAVRADFTRRGVLTELMQEQLRISTQHGEVLVYGHGATEAVIWGRFGYGVATQGKTIHVRPVDTRFRDDAPVGGHVRLLRQTEAAELIPQIYEQIGLYRNGMIARPREWWRSSFLPKLADHRVAVHSGRHGDDGFALYRSVERRNDEPSVSAAIQVSDLHAPNTSALVGLWRFLLSIDLVSDVRAPSRPFDESVGLMLVDTRAFRVASIHDHTILRIVDVMAALSSRAYRLADPVIVEVTDRWLHENNGTYRISIDGTERTDRPAQLRLDVETLGMIYLGAWKPSTLAAAGRVSVLDSSALSAADELFYVSVPPWCGTAF